MREQIRWPVGRQLAVNHPDGESEQKEADDVRQPQAEAPADLGPDRRGLGREVG